MKRNMGSIVRITVDSKLPEFKNAEIFQKLVDKSVTWDSFLRNNGITMDPAVHLVSALHGKVKALPQNQIAEVVDAFRNKLSVYKVVIVRNVNAGPPQSRLIQQNEHQEEMGPPCEPVRSSGRKRKAVRRYEDELLEGRPMNDMAEEEDPLEVPSSSIAGPEPDFLFTMPQQHPRGQGRQLFDRGEVASVVTNDTFESDIGEDIKGVIVEKLRHWATNGDLYRIREELRVLQANRKSLRVARYIPYTMNVLGVLFGSN